MKIYQDLDKNYFGLLYVQNEKNTRGGATPSVEPTWWFQPLKVRSSKIGAKSGLEKVPGAWPVSLAENLVSRVLSEFQGSISDVTTLPVLEAEPGPKTKIKKEETE